MYVGNVLLNAKEVNETTKKQEVMQISWCERDAETFLLPIPEQIRTAAG